MATTFMPLKFGRYGGDSTGKDSEEAQGPFLFRKIFILLYEENCYYNNVWKSVIQFTLGRQQ